MIYIYIYIHDIYIPLSPLSLGRLSRSDEVLEEHKNTIIIRIQKHNYKNTKNI